MHTVEFDCSKKSLYVYSSRDGSIFIIVQKANRCAFYTRHSKEPLLKMFQQLIQLKFVVRVVRVANYAKFDLSKSFNVLQQREVDCKNKQLYSVQKKCTVLKQVSVCTIRVHHNCMEYHDTEIGNQRKETEVEKGPKQGPKSFWNLH